MNLIMDAWEWLMVGDRKVVILFAILEIALMVVTLIWCVKIREGK